MVHPSKASTEERKPLPIDKYEKEILKLIKSNDVAIISASTGSGKSTRIPQMMLRDNDGVRIVVCQPKRIGTTRVAARVAEELGTKIGDGIVGYSLGLNNRTTPKTRITFLTAGTLVQMICHSKTSLPYTHIILDEIHGRDIHNNELLLAIKLIQQRHPKWKTKIILLSATLVADKLERYFSHKKVGILEIPMTVMIHPITTYYIDDLEEGTPEGVQVQGFENVDKYAENVHIPKINYDKIQHLLEQLDGLDGSKGRGAVLIFLPGVGEIHYLADLLKKFSKTNALHWVVYELHANMSDAEQNEAFPSVLAEERKIILATNIAENSITVADVKYVIDFCVAKYVKFDTSTAFSGLVTKLASQPECDQRRGRAGRTGPGFCFRLVRKDFYNNRMEKESSPEMKLCCLDLAVLHLKILNMGNPADLFKEALDPPDMPLIQASVLCLKEVGALTIRMKDGSYNATDGELTIIGDLACHLCCDPRQARMIAFGEIFGLLDEAVVMAMSSSSKSLFATFSSLNAEKAEDSFAKRMEIVGGALGSDAITNLGAYNMYMECKNKNRILWDDQDDTRKMKEGMIKSNLKNFYIKYLTMKSFAASVNNVRDKLAQRYYMYMRSGHGGSLVTIEDLQKYPEKLLRLQLLLAAASYPNIFPNISPRDYEKYLDEVNFKLEGQSSLNLQVPHSGAKDPTPSQLEEIKQQFQNFCHSATPALDVTWNKEEHVVVITFHPKENEDWTGNFDKYVYNGLELMVTDHPFYWTTEDGGMVMLNGPKSPVSLDFKCHFKSLLFNKTVEMDRPSLDMNYPHPEIFTMASLQLMQKKYLTAKDSTILPTLSNLFRNLHLIFAPHLEFAILSDEHSFGNKKGMTDYIKGTVGLGSLLQKPENLYLYPRREPLFKSHDVELKFKITSEELALINDIRKGFNKFLHWGSVAQSHHLWIIPHREGLIDKLCNFILESNFAKDSTQNFDHQKLSYENDDARSVFHLFPPHKLDDEKPY